MRVVAFYVHGLWMTGLEGVLLRRRLATALSAHTPVFHYSSVQAGLDANAAALAEGLARLKADTLHLVGHSLGGVLILRLFELGGGAGLPPGRVLLMGSPAGGSRAAQGLAAWKWGKPLMGRTVCEALLKVNERRWTQPRDLGVIAGCRNVGLGRLVSTHPAPSDGTVYVDETRIVGAKEHLTLPVSHTGLPFSAAVAKQTAAFLRHGQFIG